MKKIIFIFFIICFVQGLYAKPYSYETEIKAVEELLSSFNKGDENIHNCTKDEVELLLREGAKYYLNLFEILYVANVYLTKKHNYKLGEEIKLSIKDSKSLHLFDAETTERIE